MTSQKLVKTLKVIKYTMCFSYLISTINQKVTKLRLYTKNINISKTSYSELKFKNIIFSKFLLLSLLLFLEIVCPAFENIRSHGTDVASTQRRFFISSNVNCIIN